MLEGACGLLQTPGAGTLTAVEPLGGDQNGPSHLMGIKSDRLQKLLLSTWSLNKKCKLWHLILQEESNSQSRGSWYTLIYKATDTLWDPTIFPPESNDKGPAYVIGNSLKFHCIPRGISLGILTEKIYPSSGHHSDVLNPHFKGSPFLSYIKPLVTVICVTYQEHKWEDKYTTWIDGRPSL